VPNRDDNVWAQVGRYSSLAFVLPVSTLVGFLLGWLLDKLFHTHFLYLVFLGLGAAAGFLELIRQVRREMDS
jgi:F0F1-type ATP synthase assembly protein I